jgi:hypothetical protein
MQDISDSHKLLVVDSVTGYSGGGLDFTGFQSMSASGTDVGILPDSFFGKFAQMCKRLLRCNSMGFGLFIQPFFCTGFVPLFSTGSSSVAVSPAASAICLADNYVPGQPMTGCLIFNSKSFSSIGGGAIRDGITSIVSWNGGTQAIIFRPTEWPSPVFAFHLPSHLLWPPFPLLFRLLLP